MVELSHITTGYFLDEPQPELSIDLDKGRTIAILMSSLLPASLLIYFIVVHWSDVSVLMIVNIIVGAVWVYKCYLIVRTHFTSATNAMVRAKKLEREKVSLGKELHIAETFLLQESSLNEKGLSKLPLVERYDLLVCNHPELLTDDLEYTYQKYFADKH